MKGLGNIISCLEQVEDSLLYDSLYAVPGEDRSVSEDVDDRLKRAAREVRRVKEILGRIERAAKRGNLERVKKLLGQQIVFGVNPTKL